jgi:hypothetical protein
LRLSSGASFFARVTSMASSITRFINSSKPYIVVSSHRDSMFRQSYPQLSLNAHAQVFVQPYRDGRP